MAGNSSYKKWHGPSKNIYNEEGDLKKGRTHQGFYIVKNKEKYIGDSDLVVFRSAWEFSFCMWSDYSPSIVRWSSEPVKVPYYDRVSNLEKCKKQGLDPNNPKNWTRKNYNTDFWIEVKKPDETFERWFIEIKPGYKLMKPKPVLKTAPLKDQKKFNKLAKEYLINESKFEAMKNWSSRSGAKFYVFTEDQLRRYGIIEGRFDIKKNKHHIRQM